MAELRNVKGLEGIRAAMRDLAPAVQQQLMRPAVGAAAATVQAQAVQDAPLYHGDVARGHPPPGTLKKAIQRKFLGHFGTRTQWITFVRRGKRFRNVKTSVRMVGPLLPGTRRARMVESQDAFYWFWVNFGTAKMPRNPYMSDALPKSANEAIDAMRISLTAGLKRLQVKGMKK